jgi:LPS O-antigen subunit length determinant protein (WzzB/FepE family)
LEEYLIQNTNSVELRESVSKLLENEIKTQMYANIQSEYLLEQIEKPRIILEKSNPKRSIWLIFGFVLGLIVSFGMIIYGKVISGPKT